MNQLSSFSASRMLLLCVTAMSCWLGMTSLAASQPATSAAPESHVLDKANLFREKPAQLAEITATLKRIQEKHGYLVYLAVYYNVLDGSVQMRADELYKHWLADEKRGLVMVVQLDPAVDGKTTASSYYRTSGLEEDPSLKLIPDGEMESIVLRVLKSGVGKNPFDTDSATALAAGIEKEMDSYYAVEPAKWSDAGNVKLMAIFLGVLTALVILGAVVWKRFASAEVKSNHSYFFPEVDVAQRLGAPYGGGWVSEASFVPVSSRK